MAESEKHIALLFTAELQFRLASAVRLATSLGTQPIDLPITWTHGDQTVGYGDIALRPDQADYAAHFLQHSGTYLLAVAVKDAIRAVVSDPKASADSEIRAAYQISRLIRMPSHMLRSRRSGRLTRIAGTRSSRLRKSSD